LNQPLKLQKGAGTITQCSDGILQISSRNLILILVNIQKKNFISFLLLYFENMALLSIANLLKGFLVKQNGQWLHVGIVNI
jgi:hypothetical protein